MSNYGLLSVIGIEIEYMLVDKDTLNVRPLSDVILQSLAGALVNEVALGSIAVSNELVMHVLEMKNNGPQIPTGALRNDFQKAISDLQPILDQQHLKLLPGGAHPWMNPMTETKRWPYGNKAIYQQYDNIFNCQGHGWANLQSMHVNLPFSNDEEFCYLHNGIRLLLPLIPALAASTPILEGCATGILDSRLQYYAHNQRRIPSISGSIIPEPAFSQVQYEKDILQPMYKDIASLDTNGILQYPWLNSRGVIPKFDVNAVEIRIIDSQECVKADVAIALLIHALLMQWSENFEAVIANPCETKRLKSFYDQCITSGLSACIDDSHLLKAWQLPTRNMTARDAWHDLIERAAPSLDFTSQQTLESMLRHGNLSERLLHETRHDRSHKNLQRVYNRLADCLLENELFACL